MRSLLLLLLSVGLVLSLRAQLPAADSLVRVSREAAVARFDEEFLTQLPVYSGVEEFGYPPAIKGSPYFAGDDWISGKVFYQGRWYSNLSLRYDLVSGNLLVKHYNHIFQVRLIRSDVDSFYLDQSFFVQLRDSAFLPVNFYQVLYSGHRKLLVTRSRAINENIDGDGIHRWFTGDKAEYFIHDDSGYYPVFNKKALWRYFGSRQGSVRQYLHRKHLKYRKAPESVIVEAVRFFDGLK